jgi:hypothetical protein
MVFELLLFIFVKFFLKLGCCFVRTGKVSTDLTILFLLLVQQNQHFLFEVGFVRELIDQYFNLAVLSLNLAFKKNDSFSQFNLIKLVDSASLSADINIRDDLFENLANHRALFARLHTDLTI